MQVETLRVLSDWWFNGLSLLFVSVESLGKVRLMRPAGFWSRLTFPPQWLCDKANVLSEERNKDAGKLWHISPNLCVTLQ